MDCRDDLDEVAGLFEHGAHTVALDGMNHEAIMRKLLLDRIYHSIKEFCHPMPFVAMCSLSSYALYNPVLFCHSLCHPELFCNPLCHPERSRRVYKRFLDKLGMTEGKGSE